MKAILENGSLELGFVWNRTYENVTGNVDEKYILKDLSKFSEKWVTNSLSMLVDFMTTNVSFGMKTIYT